MFDMTHNVPSRTADRVKRTKRTVHNHQTEIAIIFRNTVKRDNGLLAYFVLVGFQLTA